MGRAPTWAALLPLLIGAGGYWLYWEREAAAFRREIAVVVPAVAIEIAGFPYRVEARLPETRIERSGGGVALSLVALRVTANRQPWRTGHVVIAAERPRLDITVNLESLPFRGWVGAGTVSELPAVSPGPDAPTPTHPLKGRGLELSVEGPSSLASVRRAGGLLERASARFEQARVVLPFAGAFAATGFELHLRETPSPASDTSPSPTLPVQAEARIAGTLSRGPLQFGIELPLFATAARRITSLQGWRAGGTLEIRDARLLGAGGKPVAGFDATLAPLPDGRIAVAGTVATDCPATVRALLAGEPAPAEFRTRITQTMSIGGFGGDISLGAPTGPSGGPVRSQEPPCPVLRR